MKNIIITLVLISTMSFTKETNFQPMGYNIENVQGITRCGEWEKDNKFGYFRILESFTNGQNYLYIDMMSEQLLVIEMFSIKEINGYHSEVNFAELLCKGKGLNKIEIKVKAFSGYIEKPDSQIVIVLDAITKKYTYNEKNLKYKIDLYKVVNVDTNDTLNLRENPNNKSKIVVKLKPNTRGIKAFNFADEDRIDTKWIKVEVNGKVGWVYAKYVEVY